MLTHEKPNDLADGKGMAHTQEMPRRDMYGSNNQFPLTHDGDGAGRQQGLCKALICCSASVKHFLLDPFPSKSSDSAAKLFS